MDTLTRAQQYIADTAYVTNDAETVVVLVQDGRGPADGLAAARHRLDSNSVDLVKSHPTRGGTFVTYTKGVG